ncbi:ubiquitin specific protease 8 isoform X1 [Haematobia irritans]|uniref:ubiquitin specific protease 8 isoform X1 n=1 Tax=Haematobia irritans TaxID=7368 RepID=UPI003F506E26
MAHVKELYMCTNIDDLEKLSAIRDVREKKMKMLLEAAKKLSEEAQKYYLKGDEEMAYIFYTRYFNMLNTIYKKREYAESKPLIREMLGDNRSNKLTMDRLEKLTQSLHERYDRLNAKNVPDKVYRQNGEGVGSRGIEPTSMSQLNSTLNNTSLYSKSINVAEPTNGFPSSLRLMTCQELFNSMQSQKVLVMDCRSSDDYKMSHLNYPLVFNVPQELIRYGMSAGKLQDKLDPESKKLWSARAIKDQVVLMDWSCSDSNPPETTAIGVLLNILQNWDPDVTYRSPIKILDGGYEYFKIIYPTKCTNPSVQAPSTPQNDLNIVDDIEYPTVSDIQMKDEVLSTTTATSPIRPLIDRSSKQAAMKTYSEKEKAIDEIVKEQEILLEKAQENDEELQKVAQQWKNIYNKKQWNTTEQEIVYKMMQLESAAEDYKLDNMRLREELEEYKRREKESAFKLPSPTNEVVEKTTKEIEAKIVERQRRDEQLEKEKLQREAQLAIARENKKIFQARQQEKQTEQEEPEKPEIPAVPPTSEFAQPKSSNIPQFDRSVKPQLTAHQQQPAAVTPQVYALQKQRDFSPIRGSVGRGLTGLKNLGNTCYMNSILQCLSNTPQLAEYCITDKYKNYVSRNNKTKGQIVEEVAALIKVLWNGNYKCVASKDLRYVIGQYQKMFRGIEQQDSHEFLTILMDWLHSDLQTLSVPEYPPEPMTASDKAWLDFTKAKESLILHLFYGQIKSIVKCTTCGKESATYESFSNLSLELPENNNICHLSQCLDMYFSGERISGWNCPACKQKRDAIKKLDISKLPPVLVVHLKRFYADTDFMHPSYKKKQNYLRFPLENLNMSSYITVSETRRNTSKSYDLYAVSNHYGSMESGHYTAFCKSGTYGKWFKFDDQMVTPQDASTVVSSAAYILFYTRLAPSQYSTEINPSRL